MIGVFDSGLGGLTILKSFFDRLPGYDFVYLGDNARAPYGSRSQDIIYKYSRQAADFLFSQGCQLIVFACHTASALALRRIQQDYLFQKHPSKRILGVIRPLVEAAAENKNLSRIGILGTKATINSGAYQKELLKLRPNLKVFSQAAPLLVPLIEEGWINRVETKMILKKYLRPLKNKQIQALILACTHYPFLLKQIKRAAPKRCLIVNSGEITAEKLNLYLRRHKNLDARISKKGNKVFYTTGDIGSFKNQGEKFLGQEIKNIKKVSL